MASIQKMKRTGEHNSGLTVEEIKRCMRHYTRAEKARERKRRAELPQPTTTKEA
ncbi:hypothetical protein IP92_04906 [Pseudoduganella flava]|uniref:Integrase n=1 Tax=Pseudoduganella flava TaxID=871742 RepID=A0A562PHD0_9BURK|nr:hypothetical protein [Pseudoduganella flava]QGZ42685.1 hypothetical protein GO485_29070 [Pseudoduganella flava]TWI43851.1 hypothetical protein IP92_04906 [Pseudoduganella flava]